MAQLKSIEVMEIVEGFHFELRIRDDEGCKICKPFTNELSIKEVAGRLRSLAEELDNHEDKK